MTTPLEQAKAMVPEPKAVYYGIVDAMSAGISTLNLPPAGRVVVFFLSQPLIRVMM